MPNAANVNSSHSMLQPKVYVGTIHALRACVPPIKWADNGLSD